MAEIQLITLSDIQAYRHVDPTYQSDKLNPFITSVQRRNLRDLLSDDLYYDFMNSDRTTGKYKDLLDGKTYTYSGNTIQYYGLKPVLCYWILALMAKEGEVHNSYHGTVEYFDNPQQQFKPAKNKERLAVGYMEEASNYANEAIKFLDKHNTTYALWDSKENIDGIEFTTFKI